MYPSPNITSQFTPTKTGRPLRLSDIQQQPTPTANNTMNWTSTTTTTTTTTSFSNAKPPPSQTQDFFAGFGSQQSPPKAFEFQEPHLPTEEEHKNGFANPSFSPIISPKKPEKAKEIQENSKKPKAKNEKAGSKGNTKKQKTITEMFAFSKTKNNKTTASEVTDVDQEAPKDVVDDPMEIEEISNDSAVASSSSSTSTIEKNEKVHPSPVDLETEEKENKRETKKRKIDKKEELKERERKNDSKLVLSNEDWKEEKRIKFEKRKQMKDEEKAKRFAFLENRRDINKLTPGFFFFFPKKFGFH